MLSVNPRAYSRAIWELACAAPAAERGAVLAQAAQDLVGRFRAGFRSRVLMALEKLEQEGRGAKPLKIIAANETLTEQLSQQFASQPLEFNIDPRLKAGVVLEQGEKRVDASLRRRLRILRTVLTKA